MGAVKLRNFVTFSNHHHYLLPTKDYTHSVVDAIRTLADQIYRHLHSVSTPCRKLRQQTLWTNKYIEKSPSEFEPSIPDSPVKPADAHDPIPTDPAKKALYVGTSTLPDAGNGGFFRKSMPKHTIIGNYFGGKNLTHAIVTSSTYKSMYSISDERTGIAFDALKDPATGALHCLTGYLNDPLDNTKVNCEFKVFPTTREIKVRLTRRGIKDEEGMIAYGWNYWCTSDHPLPLLLLAYSNYVTPRNKNEWHKVLREAYTLNHLPIPPHLCSSPSTTTVQPRHRTVKARKTVKNKVKQKKSTPDTATKSGFKAALNVTQHRDPPDSPRQGVG
eukprot:CAMPEP_0182420522 /NCGR_PEP_ID=MMETSP1167-20130531/5381_1 /TAXON_ID=2988 /ORGANISM="Mallomonas Sp, Strain CCMP3275" /LENGTH=329 /DNA_ID=CAMNT_0024596573 /DNA_START=91 /DNA_END=1080 /DNA_ORIENTATION=+